MSLRPSKFLLLAVVAFSISQSYGQEKVGPNEAPLTWVQFVSEEGRFRVQMPDKPKFEVSTYESGKSRLVHNVFTVEKGAFIWLVDYADLPREIDTSDPVAFLNKASEEFVSQVNGTVQQRKSLTLEGHPGLDVTMRIYGGSARVRLYLANKRLYQLLVTRLELISKSDEPILKFLDSFKITNEETPHTMWRPTPKTRNASYARGAYSGVLFISDSVLQR